ncbi:MAG TPA: bifunctional lysylphosphatidylglycerol flippase/synthetase MprF [Anaeromyxobacter sp.]|nr:bifunctional lysylphosphatidylglycerol flippase/synthetase MprF [Anaeromyxobacter sp.]
MQVAANVKRAALVALPAVLLVAAGWALERELHGFHFRDLERGLAGIPRAALWAAAAATAADYLLLSAYDLLALVYAGKRLPASRVVFTSFVAYAFGNNVGLSLLSSGSVRVRLYSQWGLGSADIARIVAFTAAQLWAGLLPLAGIALLAGAPGPLPEPVARSAGVLALAATAAYLVLAARGRELSVRGLSFRLPSLALASAQVVVSAADWALAAFVLYLLLPSGAAISFPAFLGLFIAAQIGGLASQIPGGVGVFDSIVLAALTPSVPAPEALSSLVAFRVVYYLVPFLAAFAMLVGNELVVRREKVGRVLRGAHASFAPVVPWLAAGGAVLAGAVLLFSGATPAENDRLHALRRAIPLAVLEASHLVGSLVGIGLLLLARALSRRLDGAWVLALALLAAGAIASIAKGLDYEEATILLVLFLALLPFRGQFYRRSPLLGEPLGPSWLLGVASILAASVWIGQFAYRHVEYSRDALLEFAFHAQVPRFLRATVLAVSAVALYGVAALLRPRAPAPSLPGPAELARARPLVDRAPESLAHAALVGDKALLFSPDGDAFLMYAIEGRSWVALGDPGGPDRAATELAWRFRELSDRHHGWACFYQVGPGSLPRYLDLGLSLYRLGEEAVVPLHGFTLEGGERRGLRQSYHRGLRDGLELEVVPADGVPPLLPDLRAISDAWLAEKNVRERGFSIGYFDERYLAEGPVAIARLGGRRVAFANLWTSSCREELSFDLMRHLPDAPRSTMDFLFVSMIQWGKDQGYRRFSLGMAPLSGLEDRALAPLWTKVGARLYRHGEYFYNFQGLRQYKEKFAPEWRPRFLASPGGLRLPRILASIAALGSRGLKGVVGK